MNVGEKYRFTWPTLPQDYVIPAGHQLGIVLVANYPRYFRRSTARRAPTVTLDARVSKVRLPVVGGYRAAVASGAFAADTVAPELRGMPANIAVDTDERHGRTVTYTPPTATDNEDPAPEVAVRSAVGREFRGRHDRRRVHGDRRERQHDERVVHRDACAGSTRRTATSTARCRGR